jgi:hypothetical protein
MPSPEARSNNFGDVCKLVEHFIFLPFPPPEFEFPRQISDGLYSILHSGRDKIQSGAILLFRFRQFWV